MLRLIAIRTNQNFTSSEWDELMGLSTGKEWRMEDPKFRDSVRAVHQVVSALHKMQGCTKEEFIDLFCSVGVVECSAKAIHVLQRRHSNHINLDTR